MTTRQEQTRNLNRILIIVELQNGPKKWSELLRKTGLSQRGLTNVLRSLEKDKVIQKVLLTDVKPRKGESRFTYDLHDSRGAPPLVKKMLDAIEADLGPLSQRSNKDAKDYVQNQSVMWLVTLLRTIDFLTKSEQFEKDELLVYYTLIMLRELESFSTGLVKLTSYKGALTETIDELKNSLRESNDG